MNWIKENKFVATLAGITLVLAIILFVIGGRGGARYNQAQERYQAAADEVGRFERLPLYPKDENRDGKRKALTDYRASVEELQASFDPYRVEAQPSISPQEFTNRLIEAEKEVRAAFQTAGATLPDAFYLGFEQYTTGLARENATGVLNFQLGVVRDLMISLAESSPSALINLHRPRLPEEDGNAFSAPDGAAARELPLEITFKGREQALRAFLTTLVAPKDRYLVVRSLRVLNERREPPRTADVQLAAPEDAPAAEAADPFGGFFIPGDDEPAAAAEGDDAVVDAGPEAAPAIVGDSGQILSQIVGNEEVIAFLRIDILQFLPAQELVQVQN
jgi:hypothetical protein